MSLLTPKFVLLVVVACIASLLATDRFIGVAILVDVGVVSLLLPEWVLGLMARLVAGVCILLLGIVVCLLFYDSHSRGYALYVRFPFLYQFLSPDCRLDVFLYGLPLFLLFALLAISKRRLARKNQVACGGAISVA